jgi:hypothetical protein
MIKHWMSWEGGVDLTAVTVAGLSMPNVIVHVARMVHTPVGSAPAGMIFYQPDPKGPPVVMGFVSTNEKVGQYFGPNIFKGTPFENAPVLVGSIEITTDLDNTQGASVTSIVKAGPITLSARLSGLKAMELINREPMAMPPFHQQGLEASAQQAVLRVNGEPVSIIIPPTGISGGPAAVWSASGIYAR